MEDFEREDKNYSSRTEAVDILNGEYLLHWGQLRNLRKIFRRGLYSQSFAERIKDNDYESVGSRMYRNIVHLTSDFDPRAWEGRGNVGIVVDNTEGEFAKFRISPRQFKALVIRLNPHREDEEALRDLIAMVAWKTEEAFGESSFGYLWSFWRHVLAQENGSSGNCADAIKERF